MSNINFTQWGTTTITIAEAVSDISNIFNNVFNKLPNLSPSSPTGAFIQELATMETNVNNTMAYVTTNVYGLNTTNGIFLDGIGNLFGIKRIDATYTVVTCQCLGLPNLVIPANSIVSDGTYQYKNANPITINSLGIGTGNFTCTIAGQIVADANSVNIINTPLTGWYSVNNNTNGVTGNNIQNDTSYRYVLKYAQAQNGRSFVESLFAIFENFIAQDGSTTTNVEGINIPYIQGFYIYSNYTDTPVVLVPNTQAIAVGGVYITLHAPQYLDANNPDLQTNLQYIAGIILNQIGANSTHHIQTLPTNQYTVLYQNTKYPQIDPVFVLFDAPIDTPIKISFSITLYNQQINKITLQNQLKDAILDQFYNGYTVNNVSYRPATMGLPINTGDFIANIVSIAGACNITSQDIQLVTGGTAGTSLTLTVDKIATLTTANILITLV